VIRNIQEHTKYYCHSNFSNEDCLGRTATIMPDGPAIKGGCGTWRSHPVTYPGTLAVDLSRWQARYGVLSAIPGISFIVKRRGRGISFKWTSIHPGIQNWQTASCAVSRYKLSRSHKLSWYRELYYLQWYVSGCRITTDPDRWLRISKKHDKQLTFIDRVSLSDLLKVRDKLNFICVYFNLRMSL